MEKNAGIFTRQLFELASEAMERAIVNGQASVTAKLDGAEAPQKCTAEPPGSGTGVLRAAACGLIPGAVCAVCVGAKLPAMASVILTALGGVGGTALAHRLDRRRPSEAETETGPTEPLKAVAEVDEAKAAQARRQKDEDLQKIVDHAREFEQSVSEAHDVTLDRKFGEWAQSFLILTAHSEDRSLLRLRNELLNRLACMKIHVYDELTLNEDGEPDVPYPDYLIDAREDGQYHELVRPLLYSDKGILARGKVR